MDLSLFPDRATICSPEHTLVRVRGADPLAFLQDTTTQEVRKDASVLSCLLDGTGHVLAFFRIIPLADEVLLEGPVASKEALTGWLARVAPLSGCEVVDESDAWNLTMIRGVSAADALGGDVPNDFLVDDERITVRVDRGIAGFDLITRNAVPAETMRWSEWDAWRARAGIPLFGVDVSSAHIVNETPYLSSAVAELKGCYPGQETVAKIRNLGRARRAVVGLRFESSAPPAGAEVLLREQVTGTVTSSGFDGAIATVRREAVEAGEVLVAGLPAAVVDLG